MLYFEKIVEIDSMSIGSLSKRQMRNDVVRAFQDEKLLPRRNDRDNDAHSLRLGAERKRVQNVEGVLGS